MTHIHNNNSLVARLAEEIAFGPAPPSITSSSPSSATISAVAQARRAAAGHCLALIGGDQVCIGNQSVCIL